MGEVFDPEVFDFGAFETEPTGSFGPLVICSQCRSRGILMIEVQDKYSPKCGHKGR